MNHSFLALDVETANPDLASICQIGIVWFENGEIADKWQSLVNPQDYFDPVNISIHGIDFDRVKDAPTFERISSRISEAIQNKIVVIHTGFDKSAISQSFTKHQIPSPACTWLDSSSVARRAWPDVAQRGYGLKPLAERFQIEFRHHDALEDAGAAGMIFLRAIRDTGIGVKDWLKKLKMPITPGISSRLHAIHGNADGALHGETIVFTGQLSLSRIDAATFAAQAGCEVANSVTKHTTLLVVGDQYIRLLAGHNKSSKHRRAEELTAKGQRIRILGESDFMAIIGK